MNKNYYVGASLHRDLISPFYSPCLTGSCVPGSHPGTVITWWQHLARPVDPDLPARLPAHLLLLPQGLLPVVLAGPTGLCRLATATAPTPASPASRSPPEHPPLLLLLRAGLQRHPDHRRHRGVPSAGHRHRVQRRHRRAADQRHPAVALLAQLPCLPAPVRRRREAVLQVAHPPPDLEDADPAQRQAHAVRLDEPRASWPSPISTSDSWPAAPSTTTDSTSKGYRTMAEYETHEFDVIIVGAGGAGLRAAIEARSTRTAHRPGVQVPAGQGPHRHGRRRRGRRPGQRLRGGQLEGPLPGHHAGRQDAQQLAHGPAPRPGVPRPGPRARGLGGALRSDQGRPDPPA